MNLKGSVRINEQVMGVSKHVQLQMQDKNSTLSKTNDKSATQTTRGI